MSIDHGPRVGADPEIFVQNLKHKIVPICSLIGGTKEFPTNINNLVDINHPGYREARQFANLGDFAVQEDNVMLEFNVPATTSSDSFVENIQIALGVIKTSFLRPQGLDFRFTRSSHQFANESLIHKQAKEIGCSCDFDAYHFNPETDSFKRKPFCAADFGNERFCGGHIHVQYDKDNCPPEVFAQLMDCVLGVPSIVFDEQQHRRQYYGQPGLYREKSYGIEYRTLSNFWLQPKIRERWLHGAIENVLSLASSVNKNPEVVQEIYSLVDLDSVQDTIKTENKDQARVLMKQMTDFGLYISPLCFG